MRTIKKIFHTPIKLSLGLLVAFFAILLLFGISSYFVVPNEGANEIQVVDRFIDAETWIPKVVKELSSFKIFVQVIGNVDMNVTSIRVDFGKPTLQNGSWIIADSWKVNGDSSFSLLAGMSKEINFVVTSPNIEESGDYAAMLTITASSNHFDHLDREELHIAMSDIVTLHLKNSFFFADSIMLTLAVTEMILIIFFIISAI